jgi:chemotaxis methyl-accepting protein methylase
MNPQTSSDAVNQITEDLTRAFNSRIRNVATDETEDYIEVAITAGEETKEDAASLVTRNMVNALRDHNSFNTFQHVETVVPVGPTNGEFRYTLYVRERLD